MQLFSMAGSSVAIATKLNLQRWLVMNWKLDSCPYPDSSEY